MVLFKKLKSLSRTPWNLFFVAIFITLIVLLGMLGVFLLRAVNLVYSLSPAPPPLVVRASIKVLRHSTSETDFSIAGENGPVLVRMIFPVDLPHSPIVVLVHGLAPDGNKDPLLNYVAVRLAQAGIRVVMPDIPCEQHRLMRSSDLDNIGAAIRWSAGFSGQRVSLFGISFGGGLALTVAEMPQYANLIKVVFSDAGYNDLGRLGRYYLGERVTTPNGHPYPQLPPSSGPLLVALQHLDEMIPSRDVPAIESMILNQSLGHDDDPVPPDALTPTQVQLYDDLRTMRTPAIREKYQWLLEHHHAEWAAISPDSHMGGLRAPLFILHGSNDRSIPPGEALWTLSEVRPGEKVQVLITPWMAHAVLKRNVSLWEMRKIVNFVSKLLNYVFRPAPL